ncbi:hypothetical protein [Paraburkholderia aromaticivorans]|nr:hypothetical protein [Paraburkholderia aromaticivorans]
MESAIGQQSRMSAHPGMFRSITSTDSPPEPDQGIAFDSAYAAMAAQPAD